MSTFIIEGDLSAISVRQLLSTWNGTALGLGIGTPGGGISFSRMVCSKTFQTAQGPKELKLRLKDQIEKTGLLNLQATLTILDLRLDGQRVFENLPEALSQSLETVQGSPEDIVNSAVVMNLNCFGRYNFNSEYAIRLGDMPLNPASFSCHTKMNFKEFNLEIRNYVGWYHR